MPEGLSFFFGDSTTALRLVAFVTCGIKCMTLAVFDSFIRHYINANIVVIIILLNITDYR